MEQVVLSVNSIDVSQFSGSQLRSMRPLHYYVIMGSTLWGSCKKMTENPYTNSYSYTFLGFKRFAHHIISVHFLGLYV
jgi:hypothetical protein